MSASKKDAAMLEIRDLHVEIDGKLLLHDINLRIDEGETLALFGPNGSGKTSLMMTIMGFPRYKVVKGSITYMGQDVTHLPLDERARLGIGVAFQRPPVIRGVTVRGLAQALLKDRENGMVIEELARRLDLEESLERDLNYGFSGGELRRLELLQLMVQGPNLLLFDEPESGVDLVNIALVGDVIDELLHGNGSPPQANAGLIISHTGFILDYVKADRAHCMIDGTLGCEGGSRELLRRIRREGYQECFKWQLNPSG